MMSEENLIPDEIFVGRLGGGFIWGKWTEITHKSNAKYVRNDIVEALRTEISELRKASEEYYKRVEIKEGLKIPAGSYVVSPQYVFIPVALPTAPQKGE